MTIVNNMNISNAIYDSDNDTDIVTPLTVDIHDDDSSINDDDYDSMPELLEESAMLLITDVSLEKKRKNSPFP
tara:strand:- start:223 stop:441 length:219 start_codon:yes stop_codon:yes gene_type:complete